jgi:hypothetical protein
VHGTTGERPIERFVREEAASLGPLDGRPPFGQMRELIRRVLPDATVEVDTNAYSVPWRLIGATVEVVVAGGRIGIRHGGDEVASHGETSGRRQRVMTAAHLAGIVSRPQSVPPAASSAGLVEAELLRPLSEYEQVAGGSFT